ncbi:MAG: glycosyltransferase family 39 protein [Solirubrobacterales bacterium]|nr:glycosyltransferase family 39 protein [Solirubrobacterales bacterium]MBV8946022.1 glycosyltransferase family 39 protein [Solirubrobacterales bacterium]MBV9365010.1 glycosyltransferase family 39 protein [Solirubrobacterales bacterium]MBV9810163.1 glycosyltransferase family 39 protein [Solirubrobacterales bacterium]
MLVPARSDAAVAARTSRALRVASVPAEIWFLAGIVAVGAWLRFAGLGAQSYWFDEAQAAHELHLSLGSMLSFMVEHETNPPLYFVLGWAWVHVFGAGEVALRSLSALAGTATIVLAYLCGRELVSRAAGLLAAALTALSPFMIWYSQEAREYMLLAALCGASLLFFARSWREPSRRNVVGWAVFSALAVLTHSFAGFLVAPEALWLLYVIRTRAIAIGVGAVAVVQLLLAPLLFTHATSRLLGFISSTSLSARIEQVPVAFGLGTLYESPLVRFGLLGAAALSAALIALLLIGADARQLRGVAAAAAIAAIVLLVPLGLALLGQDYYIPRALIPAWIPLAVVVGAACTAPRVRIAGGVVALVLLVSFVYAQARISSHPQYQRPDWRGVARALGPAPPGGRAIVAYDSALASDPLATYLPGVAWNQSGDAAPTVREIDVVGHAWQAVGRPLPAGVRLIGTRVVDDFLLARFAIEPARRLSTPQIDAAAPSLLGPAGASGVVLVQSSG